MEGPQMHPPNGWFNPQGDAAWRLLGCTVTSAWMPTGPVPASVPVSGFIVADSDTYAPAKLVDLDPEQQLVTEIWGLQVRIATSDGTTMMQGDSSPIAFLDIWGEDVADNALVWKQGDVDGRCMPTGRGFLPMDWLGAPSALMPLMLVEEDGAPYLGDPRQALVWLEQPQQPLDLLITDQTMPHLSGLQFR